MKLVITALCAALLLAGCGGQSSLQSFCQSKLAPKSGEASVNCECFAKTVVAEGNKSDDSREMYKALMAVLPLYSAGKDEEANTELGKKGLKYQLGVPLLLAGGAMQCAVVK